ncbi:MAG TPA: FlgD immunoglobulin-like domain containing protein, partial [Candidatus Eisenbacteria bacterium]|nr:FlgD immunoglobulin-like domain containing protein [Candidatus Eisenbacteria bacterium]
NYLLNYVSAPGGTRDSLNVEELVRLATPGAGLWTIRVEGRRIVQGPQPFALCITGGVGGPAGAVALDRYQYALSDSVEIEVIDTDASGPITAQAWSSTEGLPQNVALTGANGVFRGSFAIAPVLPVSGDGVFAVSSGDLVTVSYTGGGGNSVVATARVNVEAPAITNVDAIALGATQAVVSWTTNLNASTRVRFGSTVPLQSVADSSGYTMQHSVLLTGLQPGTTYRYDLESVTPGGATSVDSLDGQHRSFTTLQAGTIALLMDDPNADVLATWSNAFAALGWGVDVLPAAANDPPLVGNSSAGLRRYQAVVWQVDPNKYPPFSDAQRAAIDSLLDFGGRLLVTGHDIGFGLSDAGSPSYSLERELWLESGLKTRYFIDNIWADTLTGVSGSPVSGAFTDSIPYALELYPDSGDNVGAAPATDGIWAGDWTENSIKNRHIGMHWESNSTRGTSGVGVWGGEKSRLVGLFYEWRSLAGSSTSHLEARTGVLHDAVSWLLGHDPPEVHIVQPTPGAVVTDNFLTIRYSIRPDVGRTIAGRWVDYSLDGGDSWTPATTAVCADSGCIWDLGGALGGAPIPNSTNVQLRVRVADDGSPALQSTAVLSGSFALARTGGDTRGPVLISGTATSSPMPIRRLRPATLMATFTDAEMGGGGVAAAEYSIGSTPASAGSGIPMSGAFGTPTVQASAALATDNVLSGTMTFWLRGRDAAGNWGAAVALPVPATGHSVVGVDDVATHVDFLATPSPNPSRAFATIRFGLAQAGEVNLELFDVAGRRVQTLISSKLAPGPHTATWNGRDRHGNHVKNGIYLVRLTTPSKTLHTRMVRLQ